VSISGTFDGKTIDGVFGQSGANQTNSNIGPFDNVIFSGAAQGQFGGSTDGIDGAGIAFTTTDGQAYAVYTGGGQFDDETEGVAGNALTLDSFTPPCYVRGARILTDRGEVAVEGLAVGGSRSNGLGIGRCIAPAILTQKASGRSACRQALSATTNPRATSGSAPATASPPKAC
jgi:hypothetical protein